MGRTTFLAQGQLDTLATLKGVAALDGFYLAGGSAVAFHLQHRRSRDLDLFSPRPRASLDAIQYELAALRAKRLTASDAVLRVRLGRVVIDIVSYPYPPLEAPTAGPAGFPVASLLDLATMKLAAISKRGIYRDFWDLHEILTRSPVALETALEGYLRRFGVDQLDLYHVIRSVTYFDDAEKERRPTGLTRKHWQAIQTYFLDAAPAALAKRTMR
jgi:hypothetical protein